MLTVDPSVVEHADDDRVSFVGSGEKTIVGFPPDWRPMLPNVIVEPGEGPSATSGTALDPSRFFVDWGFDFRQCAQVQSCPSYCGVDYGAQRLAAYILQWQPPVYGAAPGPPGPIVLVGYSMGGLMARDVIANGYLGSKGSQIARLVTLGTPNLGYPFEIVDNNAFCPALVTDMAGSWNPATGQENTLSPFLSALTDRWASARYSSYWMAAAGQACTNPLRPIYPPFTGCLNSSASSDCVVCRDSAWYQGQYAQGLAPSTPWIDSGGANGAGQYVHTNTGNGFGTALILGPYVGLPIFNPSPIGALFQSITKVINGY